MAKMLILQGCPASGKTFFAKDFIKDKSDWVIVNRDSIRRMFGEYWVPARDHLVKQVEYKIIDCVLFHYWNVIVDDTNLNPKTIKDLENIALENGAEIEFKRFDVSLEELLKRDSDRENSVGEDVIRMFWNKYYGNV